MEIYPMAKVVRLSSLHNGKTLPNSLLTNFREVTGCRRFFNIRIVKTKNYLPFGSSIVSMSAILAFTIQSFAADATWTGATSGNSATGSNWSTAATPGIVGAGGTAGTSTDIATFTINTNTPVYYTSVSPNDWNLAGILFSGTPGAITIQSGTTGTGTRRIYFTAGGSGIVMDTTVASSMTFARTGISSGASGNVLFTNNATLSSAILNMTGTFNSLAPAASTLVLGGTNTGLNVIAGAISNTGTGVAALSVTKNDAGTWVIGNATTTNSYSGNTTINAGILGLAVSNALSSGTLTINGGALASAGASARTPTNNITVGGNFALGGLGKDITLNGTMDLGGSARTLTLNNSATIGGVISNGGLTLSSGVSTRTLTLNATNTYSGATSVSSGTLLVNGSLSGSTSVSVASGATIGGDGAITNSLTVNNGASLRIGTTTADTVVGSLDTGNFTLAGTYFPTITGNGVNDFLNITGTATFGGTIAPFLSGYAPVLNDAFNFADWSGSFTGAPTFDYTNAALTGGLDWDSSTFATDGTLRVIPEPGSALLASLGALGLLRCRTARKPSSQNH